MSYSLDVIENRETERGRERCGRFELVGDVKRASVVIFRRTGMERGARSSRTGATGSGQLALLARLTHAIPFFLAATQRMLPRNLAESCDEGKSQGNLAKFSIENRLF